MWIKRTAAVCSVLLWLSCGSLPSAQHVQGFVTGGIGSKDYGISREYVPQVSGGVMLRLRDTRVSLGGQADMLVSNGYVSGRGGPRAQIDFLAPRERILPFVSAGYFAAEGQPRWMVGGGVDVRLGRRAALRIAVQDVLARFTDVEEDGRERSIVSHEPSFQVGFVFR